MKRFVRSRNAAILLAWVMIIAFVFGGCSAAKNDTAYDREVYTTMSSTSSSGAQKAPGATADMKEESAVEDVFKSEDYSAESPELQSKVDTAERKIIRNASIEVQTEEYDKTITTLNELIAKHGGYVQDMSTSGRSLYDEYQTRHASFVVRIPAVNLDAFLFEKDAVGTVTWSNVWQEDVTMTYYDQTSRLTALRTKEARLLDILEKATELSDVIELENALSDTIYEIESITSSLNRLDNQISYSTVNVQIDEVRKVEQVYTPPKTLGERIVREFNYAIDDIVDFAEDFAVTVVGNSPIIVIWVAVIVVCVIVLRKVTKKWRTKRAAKKEAKLAEAPKADVNEKKD